MSLNIFFYLALAAWRLASLVANEDGPWMVFKRLRQRAEQWCKNYRFCRELGLYELFSCEWCNSIWIGAGLMLLYVWIGEAILYVAVPLGLSTVAIIIKYVVQLLQTAQQSFESMGDRKYGRMALGGAHPVYSQLRRRKNNSMKRIRRIQTTQKAG